MPRFIGKKSGSAALLPLTFVLGIALGAGAVGEYSGLIDLVPHFGKTDRANQSTQPLTVRTAQAHQTLQAGEDYA
ncbi:MAG: hypothetical protein HC790_03445 [Acaryochloridaceae cyanobacterium CSU_3_4]|nr:hypothetical protein [Acaryochloridaceae cyanobacterium CSU_3_4]